MHFTGILDECLDHDSLVHIIEPPKPGDSRGYATRNNEQESNKIESFSHFSLRTLKQKTPPLFRETGFLAVSHNNLTERYRLFLGSFFIVKLESLYNVLADWLKSDHTTPCQKAQMLLDPTLRDTHTVITSIEIVECGACGAAAPGFQ
jgi:hypothetical protein